MTGPGLETTGLTAYSLPLATPWRTARGELTRRSGWLLQIRDADGVTGLGECAPLPAAGTEPTGPALAALEGWRASVRGRTPDAVLETLGAMRGTPAARCAIECALLDLLARRAAQPLRCRLAPGSLATVAVNANVGAADPALAARCAAAVAAGFKVLKLKLGVYDQAAELDALRQAAASIPPGVGLRLDANGAWEVSAARDWLAALAGLPVESVEEPLSLADSGHLHALQRDAPFPLALDESAAVMLEESAVDAWPVGRVVIKPAVHGGALPALAMAGRFAAAGVEVVVTTTLEAAPGRWLCAHVAAACGSSVPHGLDTGRWLGEDLGEGPPVIDGVCRLGHRSGLGFVPA